MRFTARSAGRGDFERKANVPGSCLPTGPGFRSAVRFDRHVLCQPGEHVGAMPANRFAATGSSLRESPQASQA